MNDTCYINPLEPHLLSAYKRKKCYLEKYYSPDITRDAQRQKAIMKKMDALSTSVHYPLQFLDTYLTDKRNVYQQFSKLETYLNKELIRAGLYAQAELEQQGVDPKQLRLASLRGILASQQRKTGYSIQRILVKRNKRLALAFVHRILDSMINAQEQGAKDICSGRIGWSYLSSIVGKGKVDLLYVATENATENIVGFAAISHPESPYMSDEEIPPFLWHIELICATKGGAALMKQIIADARASGAFKITLNSVTPAVTFYRKFDFRNVPSTSLDKLDCTEEENTTIRNAALVLAKKNKRPTSEKDVWKDADLQAFFQALYMSGRTNCTSKTFDEDCLTDLWDMELCLKGQPKSSDRHGKRPRTLESDAQGKRPRYAAKKK